MDGQELTVETFGSFADAQSCKEEARSVAQGLRDYNIAHAHDGTHTVLRLFLRDRTGRVGGGLLGEISWGWLPISTRWRAAQRRSSGHGPKLLAAAEAAAVQRGCRSAHLDTFSFQARPFD